MELLFLLYLLSQSDLEEMSTCPGESVVGLLKVVLIHGE
jgi:hypothetical protein